MRKSTFQISMFRPSYGLGTIRFGFLDPKNIKETYHPWSLFLLICLYLLPVLPSPTLRDHWIAILGFSWCFKGLAIYWKQLRSFPTPGNSPTSKTKLPLEIYETAEHIGKDFKAIQSMQHPPNANFLLFSAIIHYFTYFTPSLALPYITRRLNPSLSIPNPASREPLVPLYDFICYLQLLYGVNLYSPKELFRGHGLYELVQSWKITERDQHDIIILREALLCKSRSNDEKVVIVWNMYIKAIKMGKGAMWEKGVWGEIVSFGLKSLGAWVVLISMEWNNGSPIDSSKGIYWLLMEQDVQLVMLTFDTMRVPYAKGTECLWGHTTLYSKNKYVQILGIDITGAVSGRAGTRPTSILEAWEANFLKRKNGEIYAPSMLEAIDSLRNIEASLFHSVNFLMTQVTVCAPSRKETSFAILEPLCDAAINFIRPLVAILTHLPAIIDYFSCALESEPIPESTSAYVAELYQAMLSDAQLARDASQPLSAAILNVKVPLITKLRGASGLEAFFRALMWLPWSSSIYCQGALQYLDTVVDFTVRLGDFISDKEYVGALEGRETIAKGLCNIGKSVLHNMGYIGIHTHGLRQKGQALQDHHIDTREATQNILIASMLFPRCLTSVSASNIRRGPSEMEKDKDKFEYRAKSEVLISYFHTRDTPWLVAETRANQLSDLHCGWDSHGRHHEMHEQRCIRTPKDAEGRNSNTKDGPPDGQL
ncbi:hypothetical protein IW261DRAFT_1624040 [Armillaria novae-zelandiae]|uniref:Uncharacterized protein n=1 Tax=Armillaria novae-zelandiae TaxID=153914 RepID=A0AA39NED5_9AGAR|nr:hypothetical protein IW261DRAFT_1624040 [Armillaria novae-zelandiae]